jgi:hypothetical protein
MGNAENIPHRTSVNARQIAGGVFNQQNKSMEKKRKSRDDRGNSPRGKSRMIMKLALFLALTLPVCSFTPVSSQQVSAKFENATLREVFRSLKQQTGVLFVFSEKEIDQKSRVTVTLSNLSLDDALLAILSDLPYTHEQVNDMIVIRPAPDKLSTEVALTQSLIRITGTVKDVTGQPMPGVTVMIKNTRQGTATDRNGNFSIDVLTRDDILVFSYIGMTTKEIVPGEETEIHVVLEE